MHGENAQVTIIGPYGLMLIAAIAIGVLAVLYWRGRQQRNQLNPLAEASESDAVHSPASDAELHPVRARGLRRSTRGPRLTDPADQQRLLRDIVTENRRIERGLEVIGQDENDAMRPRSRG